MRTRTRINRSCPYSSLPSVEPPPTNTAFLIIRARRGSTVPGRAARGRPFVHANLEPVFRSVQVTNANGACVDQGKAKSMAAPCASA